MRGRLSSMETDKVDKEDPRLSGAYIRTLVKHLAAKDPLDGDGGMTKNLNENEEQRPTQQQPPQQQHKKQVRRRLHTSRPYQERLLNMAEARREIVTALKFHRASMKQQQQNQQAANNHDLQSEQSPSLGQEKKTKSRRILGLYPSTTATATTTATAPNSYSSLSSPPPPPPVPCYWPISTIAPPPPPSYYHYHHDNLNFVLPSQTLGLNLNFQNFSNLDTHLYHKPLSMYSSSLSSVSSTPSTSSSAPVAEKVVVGKPKEETFSNSSGGDGVHQHHHHHAAMDDEEMEEIRSLGEQHQMEWNDTINLVTSARWSSFLKTMEIEAEERDEYDGGFDQVMEFPDWLMNANETSCLQQHFDAYLQDPALPCMDIGEIEGMDDGEWLA